MRVVAAGDLAPTNALAFKASSLADPSLVRALYDLIVAFFSMAAFAFAAFFWLKTRKKSQVL